MRKHRPTRGFIRETGRVWHVYQVGFERAICGVNFEPAYFTKETETTADLPSADNRCKRRGCFHAFERLSK